MVGIKAPKFIAIDLTNRDEIIDAVKEIGRLRPNQSKIILLIDLFNQVHNAPIITTQGFSSCGDCQRGLKNFWLNVIKEWNKK